MLEVVEFGILNNEIGDLMLYTIDEIKEKLDDFFIPLGDDFEGMRIISKKTSDTVIKNAESILNVSFPTDFKKIITEYNFGNLAINNIEFGHNEEYIQRLIDINTATNGWDKWWNTEIRPENFIVIATSDPYTILLDCSDGKIYAILSDDNDITTSLASINFELFIRSLGTLYLDFLEYKKIQSTSKHEIINETKSINISFWEYMMNF